MTTNTSSTPNLTFKSDNVGRINVFAGTTRLGRIDRIRQGWWLANTQPGNPNTATQWATRAECIAHLLAATTD